MTPPRRALVRDCEHRADAAKRELWRTLRDAFSPPLDAEDLYTLSADLDEVLNAAKDLVREMEVMDMEPDAPTHEMVTFLADAVGHLADAFRCLGTDDDATEAADAAIKSQRRVEHAYRPAMSALLQVADLREVHRSPRDLPPAVPHRRPRPHRRRTGLVLGRQRGVDHPRIAFTGARSASRSSGNAQLAASGMSLRPYR